MIKQLNNLFSTPFWTFDFHKDNPHLAKVVEMDGLTFSKYVTDKKAKNKFEQIPIALRKKWIVTDDVDIKPKVSEKCGKSPENDGFAFSSK
jgi:hypothetical protein